MAALNLLFALVLSADGAASNEEILNRAGAAVAEAESKSGMAARTAYGQAAAHYEELLERGFANSNLFGDLGNARFLAGDLPGAVLAFREGIRLAPGDRDLRQRLAFARGQVRHTAPGSFGRPPPATWPPGISPQVAFRAAVLVNMVGWAGLTLAWKNRHKRNIALTIAGVLASSVVAGWSWKEAADDTTVVVIASDSVPLRKGNGRSYPAYPWPLPRGAEARLLVERGQWVQVELSGGEVGWVERADLWRDRPTGWSGQTAQSPFRMKG